MANLKTYKGSYKGYKTLSELTGLTFVLNNVYQVQVIAINSSYYLREGTEGDGFLIELTDPNKNNPIEWTNKGDELYIGNASTTNYIINVAE